MSFDWTQFLELASNLAQQTPVGYSKEAAERTAVSRAYFGAFCYARNHAATRLGFKPKRSADDHWLLREYFKGLGKKWIEIAEDLDDLRKWRNLCDYENIVHDLSMFVSDAISGAYKIVNNILQRSSGNTGSSLC